MPWLHFDLNGSGILETVIVLSGIGSASMALLQILKNILPIHRCFNQYQMTLWARASATQLADLAMVEPKTALYALPTEKLVAQLQAAAQIALANPTKHEPLVRFLIGTVWNDPKYGAPTTLATTFLCDSTVRPQVDHYVKRNFDSFQIATAWKWTWWNRLAAVLVSILLTFLLLDSQTYSSVARISWALFAGSIAGFIAPPAKDLVSALQTLRRRGRT